MLQGASCPSGRVTLHVHLHSDGVWEHLGLGISLKDTLTFSLQGPAITDFLIAGQPLYHLPQPSQNTPVSINTPNHYINKFSTK